MMASPIDQLTEPQRDCLRLVLLHHNSKEIAARLGVSPSAVDKRLERAVHVLAVSTRFAAARMLAEVETGARSVPHGASERLPCEPIDVSPPPIPVATMPPSDPIGIARRLAGLSPAGRRGGARNRLGKRQRLLVLVGLVLLISVTTVALLNLGATLSQFVAAHRARSAR